MSFFKKFLYQFIATSFSLVLSPADIVGEEKSSIDSTMIVQGKARKKILEDSLHDFGRESYDCDKSEILFSNQLDGYSFAHYYRGLAYYEGICVSKNKKQAYHEFFQGAKQGNLDAFYFVGLMAYAGIGVKQDVDYANEVFKILISYKHDKTLKLMDKLKCEDLVDESVLDDILSEQAQKDINAN